MNMAPLASKNTPLNESPPLASPGQSASPTIKLDHPLHVVVSDGSQTSSPPVYQPLPQTQVSAVVLTNGNHIPTQPVMVATSMPPTTYMLATTINGFQQPPPVIVANAQQQPAVRGVPATTPQQYVVIPNHPPPNYSPVLMNQTHDQVPTEQGLYAPMTPVVVTNPQQQNIAPLSISANMEVVWHGHFDQLFSQYKPHQWSLLPADVGPKNWHVFKDSAKVRFSCEKCGHAWTSMKGRVIFWYNLDPINGTGCVLFRLFGQKCQKCNQEKFEHAMWYPEEVVKVVGNVYNRVGQMYYGWAKPPVRVDRRPGRPRNQHNQSLCQACKEGICTEGPFF